MSEHFQVAIVGGGAVGATLACALARSGCRTAIVETHEPAAPDPAGEIDLRVFALSLASRSIFRNLDVWEAMARRRVSPYTHMHVWDARSDGVIDFDATDAGSDVLGYIVENFLITATLWSQLRVLPELTAYCPGKLSHFAVRADGVDVQLEGGTQFSCSLLVGADGAWSKVREAAGIETSHHDYHQKGLVCVVGTEKSHEETAWQRFLPTGPVAFLPLSDGRCSIVWSTTSDEADRLAALPEDEFRITLEEALESRLGAITSVGERAAFPLQLSRARHYTGDRVALVGDAAHVVHPLAGQGVNLGLLDAAVLAEELQQGIAAKRDPGSRVILRRYERRRKGDNLLMAGVMHALHGIFGTSVEPVSHLRGFGLNLASRVPPLRNLFVRHAMGKRPGLPALARLRDAA